MMRVLAVAAFLPWLASAQSGPTFTDITPSAQTSAHADYTSVVRVAVHPLDPKRVLAVMPLGTRTSRDGGTTWGESTLPVSGVERLFVHNGLPGVVFLQTQASRHIPAFIPAITSGGRTYKSADFGETWARLPQASVESAGNAVSPFASDPAVPERLFATVRTPLITGPGGSLPFPPTDRSVLESVDGGNTWRAASDGLPETMGHWGFHAVDGPVPGAPGRLFFTAYDGRGYVSLDGARSWTPLGAGSVGRLGWIRQDPLDARVLYAWGHRVDGTGRSRILRSDDFGGTWRSIFAVENTVTYASISPNLTVDPVRKGRLWLTGLQAGVYLSEDGGESWGHVGFGADLITQYSVFDPQAIVTDLVTSAADTAQVYLISRGRLYRGILPPRERIAVEYQYGDRFWTTGDPAEAVSQDYRASDAVRSGARFGLWSALSAPPGALGICRFQGNPAYGQHSRFITLEGSECEGLKRNPAWVLEGEREYYAMPPAANGCAPGLVAVTRFFNVDADVNHRYVADAAIVDQMRALGWNEEGTAMCARPLENDE